VSGSTSVRGRRPAFIGGLWGYPRLTVGAVLLGVLVVVALAAPLLVQYGPLEQDLSAVLKTPGGGHILGTDQLGRDVLSRVVYGGLSVLEVAPAATALGVALGTMMGLAAGYAGGWADEAIMRVLDSVMALPIVVLATVALTLLGPSTVNVIVVIGAVYAPLVARTIRAAVAVEARKEYVQAAVLRGEGPLWTMFVEILPNVRGPLLVEATTRLGYGVFTAATLGFLGFGVPPPTPDWGLMVSENQVILTTAPWAVLFPALAIAFVVVAFGLVADGLGDPDRR
jgi:peptide/nickel transport system permease protein